MKVKIIPVLDDWIQRLTDARVLMGPRSPMRTQLEGWLEFLVDPSEGTDELYRQVALHGRNLGFEGRPASAALMQVLLLEDALTAVLGTDHPYRAATRELARIMVDAHAVGTGQRQAHAHRKQLVASTPLVFLPGVGPMVMLIGKLEPEVLDAAMGRILRDCVGRGESTFVVDVSACQMDDDLFHRTVRGFATGDPGTRFHMVVTGLEAPEDTRAALQNLGCPLERIRLEAGLERVLAPDIYKA